MIAYLVDSMPSLAALHGKCQLMTRPVSWQQVYNSRDWVQRACCSKDHSHVQSEVKEVNSYGALQWRKEHVRYNFDRRKGQVCTSFFDGGRTNICYNALDRHIEQGRGSQPCFLWEVSLACPGGSGIVILQSMSPLQSRWVRSPEIPSIGT